MASSLFTNLVLPLKGFSLITPPSNLKYYIVLWDLWVLHWYLLILEFNVVVCLFVFLVSFWKDFFSRFHTNSFRLERQ